MSWPTLGSLMDHFWELDSYQRLRNMRVLNVELLDLDSHKKNALIIKDTEKKDGRRCRGYIWARELHGSWQYVCITKDGFEFLVGSVFPHYNGFQQQMKRESDIVKVKSEGGLAAWY